MKASALYRNELWRSGLAAARVLPRPFLERIAVSLSLAYHARQTARREIVVSNLLPILGNDRSAAERTCRELFRQFGLKLADLWRYEAGSEVEPPDVPSDVWQQFEMARSSGKGLLLLTPHVGNWEFGAPFLRSKGVELQVITQAEPQGALTEARKAARARWGIETLVIGEDPFAFVDVIRRLDRGATVALLVDRPPGPTAVEVMLFGHPFLASVAPAELARTTGCVLLPVCIPRTSGGYTIELLPPVTYDRAALGSRASRVEFTQRLLKSFEPMILRHVDQWFHFVPMWKGTKPPDPGRT